MFNPRLLTPFISALALSTSLSAQAITTRAACYIRDGEGQVVQGQNPDDRYAIASVSKVFTSYFALKKWGATHRFATTFYITGTGVDREIHIAGAMDPMFSHKQLQFVIAQLNMMDMTVAKSITFDEKFEHVIGAAGSYVVGNWTRTGIPAGQVKTNLTWSFNNLNEGYANIRAAISDATGQVAPTRLNFRVLPTTLRNRRGREYTVPTINQKSSSDFRRTSATRAYTFQSSPVYKIIRDMNRSSNNYIAEVLYGNLGGSSAFRTFMTEEGFNRNQVLFYNGSGYPYILEGQKYYNSATCRTVVTVLQRLEAEAETQSANWRTPMNLSYLMSTAGIDGERNTMTHYANAFDGSVRGKTGTARTVTALAGTMNTGEGEIFFGVMVQTANIGADHQNAMAAIRSVLSRWATQLGGNVAYDDRARPYTPFDSESVLTLVQPTQR